MTEPVSTSMPLTPMEIKTLPADLTIFRRLKTESRLVVRAVQRTILQPMPMMIFFLKEDEIV